MKRLVLVTITLALLVACNNETNEPRTGSQWGLIPNGSAEDVVSSEVNYWTADSRGNSAIHFYDDIAVDGTKSLTIKSNQPAAGRWSNRVNLKPWSKYRFSGWIRTENLVSSRESGAGFRLEGLNVQSEPMSGTSEWTEVEFEFETGNDDACTVACLLSLDGRASGSVWFDNMKFTLLSSEKINTAVSIDTREKSEPISEYIYGQFIEHLGRCIYGGIWAEMIEDRKFYYLPGENGSPWRLTGEGASVEADASRPFVGAHSPVLITSVNNAASIRQSGLGLREGMTYSGRIILRASPGIEKVKVTLSAQDYTEDIIIDDPSGNFTEYQLKFTSPVFTHNASLSIEPAGAGRTTIGTLSLMPDDNTEGFRTDVLALLKELNSPVYRWPGGNFVSGYDWKDGIGPRDLRPPRKNPAWRGVEHNDVGMHEFITFCRLIDTEPYIAVNAGLGNVEEARQQVEYCNGDANTAMGRLRSTNGDPEPWDVKWWSIGNEMYGGWQLGHMSTEDFVNKHNQFAEAMRSVDSSIVLIAVGNVGRWDEMILANCADNMELISEHFYKQDWHGGGLMTHVKQIPDAIRFIADAHRKYRAEIPGLAEKDIRICMDEYNYWYGPHIYGELGTRYFMRDALGIAAGMNEFARQSDIIYMANYAQTVNVIGCIKTNTTHSVMASTGQVLKLYRAEFGSIPVKITGENRPLDIAAALNEAGDTLSLSIVNPTWDAVTLEVDLPGANDSGQPVKWSITAPDDMSYNEPGKPESVVINGPERVASSKQFKVSAVSINIFKIPIITN